jgi:hypothetical protein
MINPSLLAPPIAGLFFAPGFCSLLRSAVRTHGADSLSNNGQVSVCSSDGQFLVQSPTRSGPQSRHPCSAKCCDPAARDPADAAELNRQGVALTVRWRVDLVRKRAEHVGTADADTEKEAVKEAAKIDKCEA